MLIQELHVVVKENYKAIYETLIAGIEASALDNSISYPDQYVRLVNWKNGQNTQLGDYGLFAHGSFMSNAQSVKIRSELLDIADGAIIEDDIRKSWFNESMLPVAESAGGDYLCVNLTDGTLWQFIHDGELTFSGYKDVNSLISAHLCAYRDKSIKISGMAIEYPSGLLLA